VGHGRLGTLVAGYLKAFGATVHAYDPAMPREAPEYKPLNDLLQLADIVTLHASLTGDNHHLLGRAEFLQMKQGAVLVNTARGELIDEAALLESLETGRLAGAAVDVLEDELLRERNGDPLLMYARNNQNLIITPHIGGITRESREKTDAYLADKLCCGMQFSGGLVEAGDAGRQTGRSDG
jgi:phosphoglycerate dehydrogenase-like enzyme